MANYCEHCGSPPDPENPRPWRCRRCGALVPWQKEPSSGEPIVFGGYRLVRRIAAGGMGVVYEARRKTVQDFEKAFALKRLLPSLTFDADFISMLVSEAKICVQLEHPNIVQVFELDKVGSEYYIAMEYVAGSTFASLLRFGAATRRLLPVPVVVYIVSEALKGLAYAHGSGRGGRDEAVIHRDISPQNIMLGRDARIKVADFGIAKAMASSTVSRVGSVRGKLAYMAPELLTGERATPRVDVFAMGVLIHEAFSCRRLFRAETEAALISTVLRGQVPPLARYRSDVPRGVERVIRTALARKPELRYQDAATLRKEFVDALPAGMLEEGLQTAEEHVAEFYTNVGLPGEPLDPVADAPFGQRYSNPEDAAAFKPRISDAFPLVSTFHHPIRRSRLPVLIAGLLAALLGAAVVFLWPQLFDPSRAVQPPMDVPPVPLPRPAVPERGELDAGGQPPDAQVAPDRTLPRAHRVIKELKQHHVIKPFRVNMGKINKCAEAHRDQLPTQMVRVSLTIDRHGKVREVRFAPEAMGGSELARCLHAVISRFRFPRFQGEDVTVVVPLNFQPANLR